MFAVGKKIGSGIEQIVYEHFLHVVKTEKPTQVLERFRSLFIEGVSYVDSRIWATIETLAFEKTAEQNFPLVINRCCYILVNYWQMQPSGQVPVASLVDILDNLNDVRMTYSRVVRRLRQLLQLYLQGDDYPKLKRLNAVLNGSNSDKHTICPWKGVASYYTLEVDGKQNPDAAWYYTEPKPAADNIKDHVAFWKGVILAE